MREGKTPNFLSIDQVRGHLTPDLLGHTQRQLSKRDKGATYRSDQRSFNSRSALACSRENKDKFDREILDKPAGCTRILVDRANSNPQCSKIF